MLQSSGSFLFQKVKGPVTTPGVRRHWANVATGFERAISGAVPSASPMPATSGFSDVFKESFLWRFSGNFRHGFIIIKVGRDSKRQLLYAFAIAHCPALKDFCAPSTYRLRTPGFCRAVNPVLWSTLIRDRPGDLPGTVDVHRGCFMTSPIYNPTSIPVGVLRIDCRSDSLPGIVARNGHSTKWTRQNFSNLVSSVVVVGKP